MIRITKPPTVPKQLRIKGAAENAANCKAYDKNPEAMLQNLQIYKSIYGTKSIKNILRMAQHHKCCFCEKPQTDEYGAVEHFRPKMGFKKKRDQKLLSRPGYYWLAYDWSNLLFVCGVCNTTYKENIFPVTVEKNRAKSHRSDLIKEAPLLLDPSGLKDPRKHIYFTRNLIRYKTKFGKATIETCGLDRGVLNDLREEHISDIQTRILILSKKDQYTADQVEIAKQYLIDCQKPNAKFSAMASDYLRQFNLILT